MTTMSTIRDEYSEEVGDLWDAFSKALRRQGRDWMYVTKPKDDLSYLAEMGLDLRHQIQMLNDQQNIANRPHQSFFPMTDHQAYRYQGGVFSGLFGSLGL